MDGHLPISPPRSASAIPGAVDRRGTTRISGWAHDANQPDERVVVELRLAGARVAATVADMPRPDLAPELIASGACDAFHGFAFALKPEWLARWEELEVVALGAEGGEAPLDAPAEKVEAKAAEKEAEQEPPPATQAPPPPDPVAEERIAALEARIATLEAWILHLDGRSSALEQAPPPAPARVTLPLWQQALLVFFGLVGLGAIGIVVTALVI